MDNVNASSHDHPPANAASNRGRSQPDPEVVPKKAQRRRFSASYKLKILKEVDAHPDQVGVVLRREGLYSSHLSEWRKQRRQGALGALEQKRGPKGKSAEQLKIEQQQREIERLRTELYKSRAIIDAQKKLAEILGVDLPKITGHSKDDSE